MSSSVWSCVVLLVVLAAVVGSSRGLVVTDLPHLQTFDSWDTCVYDGACYEKDCSTAMQGGWSTPAFAKVLFSTETFNWWINSGLTPSNRNSQTREMLSCANVLTGPCTDHTTESTTGDGKYVYAEASGCANSKHDLTSPTIVFSNTGAYLSFYYYARGANVSANFNVTMTATRGSTTTKSNIYGGVGITSRAAWRLVNVSLSSFFPNSRVAVSASDPVSASFTFSVTPSWDRDRFASDFAIDDVLFSQNGVPKTSPSPYIDPSPSASPSAIAAGGAAAPVKTDGGGLSDAEIGGIVGGVVGGLLLLVVLLGVLLVVVLLIISPKAPPPSPAPTTVL